MFFNQFHTKLLLLMAFLSLVGGCASSIHPARKQISLHEAKQIMASGVYDWRYPNATTTLVRELAQKPPSKENIVRVLEHSYDTQMYLIARWQPSCIDGFEPFLVYLYLAAKPLLGDYDNYQAALKTVGLSQEQALVPPEYFKVLRVAMQTVAFSELELSAMLSESLGLYWMIRGEPFIALAYIDDAARQYSGLSDIAVEERRIGYNEKWKYLTQTSIALGRVAQKELDTAVHIFE